tara:strand:+ start:931 stop:1065 length:135 start_codon:yes stop_codon:yes gene_type:complete
MISRCPFNGHSDIQIQALVKKINKHVDLSISDPVLTKYPFIGYQ